MAKPEIDLSDYQKRLAKIRSLEALSINPFPPEPYPITHKNAALVAQYDNLHGNNVGIAGRLVSLRDHGRLIFGHVEDSSGRLQTLVNKNRLGNKFDIYKQYFDTGDFVGISGILDKTNSGEITIIANDVTMLAKSLRDHPQEITDAETMQRQRYLHTLVDIDARERFRVRSKLVQGMRSYFQDNLGCLEVETPILDTTYGGASTKPFKTHHNALDMDMFLRVSNELYLKRMTLSYLEGVFEFSRDFRNEGMDRTHNPEFTIVELYKPFWDYNMMMDMVEDMFEGITLKLHGTTQIPYPIPTKNGFDKEEIIDYKKPWRRLSIYDGLREKLGFEPTTISDEQLRSRAHEYGIDEYTRGDTMLKLFEEVWEKELIQPTFVKDFPAETSALTKRHRQNPDLAERFEGYAAGLEVMNCYTELNDPREQSSRFQLEIKKKNSGNKETMPYDEDFILAQEYGMPQQAGIGISIDRWTMLLTGTNHIRQAIYFPTLRPIRS